MAVTAMFFLGYQRRRGDRSDCGAARGVLRDIGDGSDRDVLPGCQLGGAAAEFAAQRVVFQGNWGMLFAKTFSWFAAPSFPVCRRALRGGGTSALSPTQIVRF